MGGVLCAGRLHPNDIRLCCCCCLEFLLQFRLRLILFFDNYASTVIDHGIASVELVMEEALQDIPTLVHDIQERLKRLSESVAVDGKPRPGLPNRRLLWDVLKPQASTVS